MLSKQGCWNRSREVCVCTYVHMPAAMGINPAAELGVLYCCLEWLPVMLWIPPVCTPGMLGHFLSLTVNQADPGTTLPDMPLLPTVQKILVTPLQGTDQPG